MPQNDVAQITLPEGLTEPAEDAFDENLSSEANVIFKIKIQQVYCLDSAGKE